MVNQFEFERQQQSNEPDYEYERLKAQKDKMLAEQESNQVKSIRLQLTAALDALRVLSTCHEKTCCSDRGYKCTCFASIARKAIEAVEKMGGKK